MLDLRLLNIEGGGGTFMTLLHISEWVAQLVRTFCTPREFGGLLGVSEWVRWYGPNLPFVHLIQ